MLALGTARRLGADGERLGMERARRAGGLVGQANLERWDSGDVTNGPECYRGRAGATPPGPPTNGSAVFGVQDAVGEHRWR